VTYIDLHIHTTTSDGTLTPREVVRYAKEKGLKAIAITDHDTIAGTKDAVEEGDNVGLDVLPGMEISVECPFGSMHLLGYCIDTDSIFLKESLEFLRRVRSERNAKILDRLKDLGIVLDYSDVLKIAGGKQIGRLHFAHAMVNKGYAETYREIFDRFLKKGAPAHVDSFRFKPDEAIDLILKSKGIPILAHPCTLSNLGPTEFENFVMQLIAWGLKGIEVYYPDHTDKQIIFYKYLAKKHGVLITGGSDYHGAIKPGIDIGVYKGDTKLPLSLIKTIRELRNKV